MRGRTVLLALVLIVSLIALASFLPSGPNEVTKTDTVTVTENPYTRPITVRGDLIGLQPFNYTYCGPECQAANVTTAQQPSSIANEPAVYLQALTTSSTVSCWTVTNPLECYNSMRTSTSTTTTTGSATTGSINCWTVPNPLQCYIQQKTATTTSITTTTPHPPASIAVILVYFPNVPPNRTAADLANQWNSQLTGYYQAVSRNSHVPYADFYGWYQVSQNLAYYGADNGPIIDAGNYGQQQPMSWVLAVEAVGLVESSGVDLRNYYDVFIMHAGDGQESDPSYKNNIWSVYYWGAPPAGDFPNKVWTYYGLIPETQRTTPNAQKSPLGVWAHEYGHALRLPDMYGNNENSQARTGHWELMSLGLWNGDGTAADPFGSSPAYTLTINQRGLGWLPNNRWQQYFAGDNVTVNLAPVTSPSGTIMILVQAGNSINIYIEARQQTGWDSYVPQNGIIIFMTPTGAAADGTIQNATPGDGSLNHGAWQAGMTWNGPHVTVRVISFTAGVWIVNIQVGP